MNQANVVDDITEIISKRIIFFHIVVVDINVALSEEKNEQGKEEI